MATSVVEVAKVRWLQVVPPLLLLRTFAISLRIRHLFLGLLAYLAVWGLGFSLLTPINENSSGRMQDSNPPAEFGSTRFRNSDNPRVAIVPIFPEGLPWFHYRILEPVRTIFLGWNILGAKTWTWLELLKSVLYTGMYLIACGWIGGAISRSAAYDLLRDETVSLESCNRSWQKHWFDYIFAPGLPFGAICFMVLCGMGLSYLLVALPVDYLQVVWGLLLVWTFLILLLLVGLGLGWPLMVAGISVSQGDGFDGFSRAFGFVYDRWRYYFVCLLVWALYGGILLLLLDWFAYWTGHVAYWVSPDWSHANLDLLAGEEIPARNEFNAVFPMFSVPAVKPPQFWQKFFEIFLAAFTYSYFWVGMTGIFAILRKSVDGTDLAEVADGPHDGPLPSLADLATPPAATVTTSSTTIELTVIERPPASAG